MALVDAHPGLFRKLSHVVEQLSKAEPRLLRRGQKPNTSSLRGKLIVHPALRIAAHDTVFSSRLAP